MQANFDKKLYDITLFKYLDALHPLDYLHPLDALHH